MIVWRLCGRRHAATAFDGEGARLHPGRWNHRGVPVVYCGSSLSLTVLEYLVHVDPDEMPEVVSIRAELPDDASIEDVAVARLPADWRKMPGPEALRDLGSAWARAQRTLALRVPSVIIPHERNVIVNPRHPEMARVRAGPPEPFRFDPRLLG
jgi:RES domain-containing protein